MGSVCIGQDGPGQRRAEHARRPEPSNPILHIPRTSEPCTILSPTVQDAGGLVTETEKTMAEAIRGPSEQLDDWGFFGLF